MKGFQAVKKDTPLYDKAKKRYQELQEDNIISAWLRDEDPDRDLEERFDYDTEEQQAHNEQCEQLCGRLFTIDDVLFVCQERCIEGPPGHNAHHRYECNHTLPPPPPIRPVPPPPADDEEEL